MTNNEIFIDTMDKINTIAKSKGFVNGLDWAKTAKGLKEMSDLDFSTFENCHNLRNLMAHGSAKDISLSNETIGQIVGFLSNIAMTRAVPTAKTVEESPLDAEKFVQEGDIVFLPFFQGYTTVSKPPKPIDDFSEIYFTNFSEKINKEHLVGGMVSRIERVNQVDGSYRLQAVRHPSSDGDGLRFPSVTALNYGSVRGFVPIIRPSTEVKVAIVSAKSPVYVTRYKLMDNTLYFTLATTRDGSRFYDLLTGREELKTYSCRVYFISRYILWSIDIKDNKPNSLGYLRNSAGLFLAYPPQQGQPYYNEYCVWRREVDRDIEYSYMDDDDGGLPF